MPMKLKTLNRVFVCSISLGLATVVLAVLGAEQQRSTSRAEFMRMKLDYSKKLLEGLVLENYDTISKNAKTLRRLSEAAEWEVPTIPNATDYVAYTGEFEKICDDLVKKCKDKNIDGATLAYVRLTMNCVNCHKYVRETPK
jgi:hypothetical protein